MKVSPYRNPSTGLDSIYQKHVWSRLGTVEPPEGSDTDGQAQVSACLSPLLDVRCSLNVLVMLSTPKLQPQ